MKSLDRPDLFAGSHFDEAHDGDLRSVVQARPGGKLPIEPLPLSEHDRAHLQARRGVA